LLQILQQKFDEFLHEVAAYEEHIEHITQTSDALTASGHSESPQIQKEQQHIIYLWTELKELANGRLEVDIVQLSLLPSVGRHSENQLLGILVIKSSESESKSKSSTLNVQVQVFDSKSKYRQSIMSMSQHSIHHSDL